MIVLVSAGECLRKIGETGGTESVQERDGAGEGLDGLRRKVEWKKRERRKRGKLGDEVVLKPFTAEL